MSQLQEKWAPVLDHQGLNEIKDPYRRAVTAQLLENQESFLREQAAMGQSTGLLTEAPTTAVGDQGFTGQAGAGADRAGFDPVMIGLIRRAMPNLMAYDICGVQPMTGPTGLIFAMRALYDGPSGNEALFNEANPEFSSGLGDSTGENAAPGATDPGLLTDATTGAFDATGYDPVLADLEGMGTSSLESAGDGTAGNAFRQMGFSIEKTVVEAKGRALKLSLIHI